jgi:clostripain
MFLLQNTNPLISREMLMKTIESKYLNILIVLALLTWSLIACDISDEDLSSIENQTTEIEGTEGTNPIGQENPSTDAPTEPKPVMKKGDTWTIMLYQDADDQVLEEDIFTDLNEAEMIGSTDKVNIVAQIDRYKGGFKGKQNFSGAKRFYLTQDDDLDVINSEELQDLGEINMADGDNLVDFAVWAIKSYPSDNYVLILSDHGSGWPGGWSDNDSDSHPDDIQIDGFDDMIYLNEMDEAFAAITEKTGIDKLDIIGFDACLMGSLEVLASTAPYARYAVLSQETEPAMGWAYSAFLSKLGKNPEQDASDLAKSIVTTYIQEDMIIVNDAARAAYIEKTYEDTGAISVSQLVAEESKMVTLAAIDLSQIPVVMTSLDELVQAMSKINQKIVAGSRSHTRAYESVFGEEYPSPYIDLGNFAKLIQKESTSERVGTAAQKVITAVKNAVIAEKHGPSQKGATGISIYFPVSKLFNAAGSDYPTYTQTANRFTGESLWDDYLTFHYTGQALQANNQPDKDSNMVGPGAGKITVQPIELTGETASPGNPVTLSTSITGDNISYLYIFTGRLTDEQDYLEIIDLDFIDSDTYKEIDGMIYPDWGEGEIPIEMDWEPVLYAIDDGTEVQMALLEPDTFGEGIEDTFYTVDGYYEFIDDEPTRFAQLTFNGDGSLLKVMGFNATTSTGPQHEITPKNGDRFIILSLWIPLNDDEAEIQFEEAGILTFGKTPWTWDEYPADPGEYVIGIIAEDLDGNQYEEYIQVSAK